MKIREEEWGFGHSTWNESISFETSHNTKYKSTRRNSKSSYLKDFTTNTNYNRNNEYQRNKKEKKGFFKNFAGTIHNVLNEVSNNINDHQISKQQKIEEGNLKINEITEDCRKIY